MEAARAKIIRDGNFDGLEQTKESSKSSKGAALMTIDEQKDEKECGEDGNGALDTYTEAITRSSSMSSVLSGDDASSDSSGLSTEGLGCWK